MRRLIIEALCHFKRVTRERVASAKTLTEVQDCLTTKDLSAFEEQAGTKSTKEKDQARDLALEPRECSSGSVYHTARGDVAHQITAIHRSSSSTLRVLRALRGEFLPLCHFKWLSRNTQTLRPFQRGRTASPRRSQRTRHVIPLSSLATLKFIWAPVFSLLPRFNSFLNSILRALRVLRGEFFLSSILREIEPEPTIHSCLPPACHSDADRRRHRQAKRQGTKKLITALLLLVGMCVSGLAQSSMQVMLDFFPDPNHVPLIVAVERGFFSDEGLDVDIVVPANPSDPIKLVAAGAVDIALTPQINLLIVHDAGLPVIVIGSLIGSPLGGLLALKENGISSLSDLRNHRIGYSLAPLEPILWRTMLASVGIEPGEYELINVGFNTVLSLLSGQVDAIGAFRNFEVPQVTIAGHEPVFFPEEEYGVPQTEEIVIAVNAERVSEDSPRMRAFLKGLARGIAFTVEHPEEAFQSFLAAYPDLDDELNRRAYEITLPLYSDGARLGSQAEWDDLQEYLLENALIKSKLALTEICTEEYLPQEVKER